VEETMACVNPDGTISETAKSILRAVQNPMTVQEAAAESKQPLFVVRSALRELNGAGLVEETDGKYVITTEGQESLQG
jgi:predicted transcriptional regulator